MKLELKHLAPYLPYKLRCQFIHSGRIGTISNIYTIGEGYDNEDIKISIDFTDGDHIWMFKPILRPLSDLTKEIEVNGEKFVPMMELFMLINDTHMVDCNYGDLDYSENNVSYGGDDDWNYWINFDNEEITLSYDIYEQRFCLMKEWEVLDFNYIEMHEKMKEWHFDVFGLIDNGVAIDINTLTAA